MTCQYFNQGWKLNEELKYIHTPEPNIIELSQGGVYFYIHKANELDLYCDDRQVPYIDKGVYKGFFVAVPRWEEEKLVCKNKEETIVEIIPIKREFRTIPVKVRGLARKYYSKQENIEITESKRLLGEAYKKAINRELGESFVIPMQKTFADVSGTYGDIYLNKLDNTKSVHEGVDFPAQIGEPVYASASGVVVLAENTFFCGKTILMNHGSGIHSLYCHLSKISIKTGELIKKNQKVGEVGSTGRSTNPHLHFGIRLNNQIVDPKFFINVTNTEKFQTFINSL